MARNSVKCANCGDILWIGDNDVVPQSGVCTCGKTEVHEDSVNGDIAEMTTEELAAIP